MEERKMLDWAFVSYSLPGPPGGESCSVGYYCS